MMTNPPNSHDINIQDLVKKTENLGGIIEFLPDAAFVLNMENKVIFWNKAAEVLTGSSKEVMLGKSEYSTAFYRTHRSIVVDMFDMPTKELKKHYSNVRRNGSVINAETFIPHFNDNKGAHVWIAASPLFDTDGRRIGAIEVVRDISEQWTLMHSLRESENRFKQLADNINEIFFLLDKTTRSILYLSSAAEDILGISNSVKIRPESILLSLIHPDDRKQSSFPDPEKRFESPINEEFRIVRPDGQIRWLRIRTFPVSGENGDIIRVAGIASDISHFKETERKEQLHRQQLIQADKMASLGILVSGVAHEINNPNNNITLSLPLLQKAWEAVSPVIEENYLKINPAPLRKNDFESFRKNVSYLLESIQEGAAKIKTIVADLKEFARIDTSKNGAVINLNAVVEAAVHLTKCYIRKNTRNFSTALYPEPLPVIGHFQKLEQVVINLIQNACDSLDNPSKSIHVTTERLSDNSVSLHVRDEGCGIPPENLSRIMDPFFTTKRNMGGTGLGLSVSDSIIRDHGGTIKYSSIVGQGTVANLILPGNTTS